MPDVDIDFANRDVVLSLMEHRAAKLATGKKHNTGVYFTNIPYNPIDNLATADYKEADELGYFKLDMLNVSIYKDVRDEAHLQTLMDTEPMWELLEHDEFSDSVFHISGHGELIRKLKPSSLVQLAAVLAIIRPAKRHLADSTWDEITKQVWTKPEDGAYYFKKAHGHSYAMAVIVHTNLLVEGFKNDNS